MVICSWSMKGVGASLQLNISYKDHLSQLQELSVVVSWKEGAVVWVRAPVDEGTSALYDGGFLGRVILVRSKESLNTSSRIWCRQACQSSCLYDPLWTPVLDAVVSNTHAIIFSAIFHESSVVLTASASTFPAMFINESPLIYWGNGGKIESILLTTYLLNLQSEPCPENVVLILTNVQLKSEFLNRITKVMEESKKYRKSWKIFKKWSIFHLDFIKMLQNFWHILIIAWLKCPKNCIFIGISQMFSAPPPPPL